MGTLVRFGAPLAALAALAAAAHADQGKKKHKGSETIEESAPPPAPAEPAPEPAAAPAGKPAGGRPILTLHMYEEDAPGAPFSDVSAGFQEGAAKQAGVSFVDLPDLLDPP